MSPSAPPVKSYGSGAVKGFSLGASVMGIRRNRVKIGGSPGWALGDPRILGGSAASFGTICGRASYKTSRRELRAVDSAFTHFSWTS